jgi:hypothetical protein
MLFAYPYCSILFLNSDIDWVVRGGDVNFKGDLRKRAKEFALIKVASASKNWWQVHLCITDPMLTEFVNEFSINPDADTCAPTFQRLSVRLRNVVSSEISASGVNECDFSSSMALKFVGLLFTTLFRFTFFDSNSSMALSSSWTRDRRASSDWIAGGVPVSACSTLISLPHIAFSGVARISGMLRVRGSWSMFWKTLIPR